VCKDEASKQLIGETVQPLPAEPGQPERFDYEYVRNCTANLFMVSEPLLGWRAVHVTERRTAKDLAEVLRWLVEDVHPEAERVVLVMDNLNTHKQPIHGDTDVAKISPVWELHLPAGGQRWFWTPSSIVSSRVAP
jgi:hypothetical protein